MGSMRPVVDRACEDTRTNCNALHSHSEQATERGSLIVEIGHQ